MAIRSYIELPGSHKTVPAATRLAHVSPGEFIEISLYLKPQPHEAVSHGRETREGLDKRRAEAYQTEIRRIVDFTREAGLSVITVEPGRRLIRISGTTQGIEAAFRTRLEHYHDGTHSFRARSGPLWVPEEVAAVTEAVLGLDTRPIAEPRHIVPLHDAASMPGHLPNAIGALYDVPTDVTGMGQCIGLVELGGGYLDSDTQVAFRAMGLPPPNVVSISVDHGVNQPNPNQGADGEVALDIQVAGGIAPGARIAVYFTPNTDAGFVNAISAAAHDRTNSPSVISISWGSAEVNWSPQALQAMNSVLKDAATLGVSVFAAAGDNLATDGINDGRAHVDFPASSPWVVGCGGTAITLKHGVITDEVVWNNGRRGTGGGISEVFGVPTFQKNLSMPANLNSGRSGRGVPDVAADAAPSTGYLIVVQGNMTTVGGTSAVAPFWAGLTALINQQAKNSLGFFLPRLYEQPNLLRPVTSGNNIPSGTDIGYNATTGWNACAGLGVPRGRTLAQSLAGHQTAATTTHDRLDAIDHVVVLMLENRSFDHMLGYLYADNNNISPPAMTSRD
ncbi:S53 family peptidase [Acidihalobacter yilgarnensis]|uniref:S53 family peptidase n=1 Tax=Acidihalobacter yilgarnensis TaxID=2819280 RepID=UPI000AD680F2|nr:S53 family peptidase [Acidihalobacter yilgarnensis]